MPRKPGKDRSAEYRREAVRDKLVLQKLTATDFAFGTAAMMRMIADYLRRRAILPVSDMGEWEDRTVYTLTKGVVLRAHTQGSREHEGLEFSVELPRLKPARRCAHLLSPAEVWELSATRALALLERLHETASTDDAGNRLWPPPRLWRPLSDSTEILGIKVRIRQYGADYRFLPHQGRHGTIVAELEPAGIEPANGWKIRNPAHIYLVHLPQQWSRDAKYKMAGPVEMPFADYELEVENEK